MSLANLAFIALENELTGMENLAGIPGTVGGAVRMNAGAYGREMKDIIVSSKYMDLDGNIKELDLASHEFSHRKSIFSTNGWIILETTIQLLCGDKPEIEQKMKDYKNDRRQKQPLEFPNAGSIFKRNPEVPTAKLIHDCGLKGYSIGDAEVSLKHAGFIVNKGKATSEDVLQLVDYIKEQVKNKFDKEIELEIIVIGEK